MAILLINSRDGFGENFSEEVSAEKTIDSQGIIYSYTGELGKTSIAITNDYVEIFREGEVTSRQIFKLNTFTDFFYSTKYFKNDFTIYTTFMEYNNGILSLSYKIFSGEDEVNSLNITIEEK